MADPGMETVLPASPLTDRIPRSCVARQQKDAAFSAGRKIWIQAGAERRGIRFRQGDMDSGRT